MQLAAVADSIVEAARVVSAFTRGGHDTTLRLHEYAHLPLEQGSRALVLDANLRGLSKLDSRTRLERLGRNLRQSQIAFFKFDSSLRRPWDDLFATLEARERGKLVLAAFSPLEGFEVRHGTVFWHGSPLHRSPLARDRHNPVYEANLPELLERQGLGSVALVRDITAAKLKHALESSRFVIVDGGNRGDAERLVESISDPSAVLWAGSAQLARALSLYCATSDVPSEQPEDLGAPTLLALGTQTTSLEHIKTLRDEGLKIVRLELHEDSVAQAVQTCETALRQDQGCVLWLEKTGLLGLPSSRLEQHWQHVISQTIAELSQRGSFERLLLCGSSIAEHTLRQLNATGIHASPFTDRPKLMAPVSHRIALRASSDSPQTLLGAYQALAG